MCQCELDSICHDSISSTLYSHVVAYQLSSKTVVTTYITTCLHNPEDLKPNFHWDVNDWSHMVTNSWGVWKAGNWSISWADYWHLKKYSIPQNWGISPKKKSTWHYIWQSISICNAQYNCAVHNSNQLTFNSYCFIFLSFKSKSNITKSYLNSYG